MAALASAVQPALNAAVSPYESGREVNQQIGTLPGTDASYGFPETEGAAATIPGGQALTGIPGNPFTESLDMLGETMGRPSAPMQTGIGPSIPYEASVPQAQVAHAEDTGASARNAQWPKPPANQYWMTDVKTAVQQNSNLYNPDGTLVYTPMGNSQVAQKIQWGDHTPLNVGIGYYIRESDRPFYNTLAATAPILDPAMNPWTPGGQEVQGYNDGGIPTVYNGVPDPYVSPTASGTEAPPMGAGI